MSSKKTTSSSSASSRSFDPSNNLQSMYEQMQLGMTQYNKMLSDMGKVSMENMEAISEAMTMASRASETTMQTMSSLMQSMMQSSLETMQTLAGCKTLREAMEVQSDWTKTTIDTVVKESSKVSEINMKTANDVISPLQDRFNQTVETMFKPIAA